MFRLIAGSLLFFSFFLSHTSFGTHIRAGEIRADRLSCSQLKYRITLIVYTNTVSPSHQGGSIGGGTLSWGEGSFQLPQVTNVTVIDANLHIGKVTYTKDITFSREGTFTISYEEAHRNTSTLNIPNSADNIDFYVEDQLHVSAAFCDSSPSFLVAPVDEGCKGMAFYHNPGATDVDGDSLSFSLTTPKGNGGAVIGGYVAPNDASFYVGLNYPTANMDKTGPPTFGIDAKTGLLTWDAPGFTGAYNIAIKVTQWKKNPADSTWMEFGYVIRDMQIEVLDCNNHPPDLTSVQDICLTAGELVSISVKGTDPDHDKVSMEVFSDITSFAESPATLQYAGLVQATSPDTAHIRITWRPDCLRVREQPYQVVVKITDHPASGVSLTRFRSFNIRVIGPAPVFNAVNVNPAVKKVSLHWNSYSCQNAIAIQVWRRVAKKKYVPAVCETGMPKTLQYQLLAELPSGATSYDDHDLAIGAQYCYRIVARFADVSSKISLDTCLIPQPAKAPVITNVTINTTDPQHGEIKIAWRSPFDIDKTQYPPPYRYEVQRGNGLEQGAWSVLTNQTIADTTFVDAALPTADTAYHYRIILYVPTITTSPVDTSSVASSIRLVGKASARNIQLSWDTKVPWSVSLQNFPYHYIYRDETGSTGEFILIDSVIVADNGFVFTDNGQYKNQRLNDHKNYSYKIEVPGGYGNPKIKEPLINFSQVVTLHIRDTIPPCPPIVSVSKPDCVNLPCTATYANTITWLNDKSTGCQNDVVYFEVYVADNPTADFTKLVDQQADSTSVHTHITDLSKCYEVVAVDWVGNRSKPSAMACGENCPAFHMPNVFTPGTSPGLNDTFHTFGPTGNILTNECSRFINFMSMKIINRWGKEIFSSSSADVSSVAWNGKDKEGNEMPPGVYFYVTDVILNFSATKTQSQQVKGWVVLMR